MPPVDFNFTNLDDEYIRGEIFLYSSEKVEALEGNDRIQASQRTGNGIFNLGTIDTGGGDDYIANNDFEAPSAARSALFNAGTIKLGAGNDTLRTTLSGGNAAIYIQRDTPAKKPGAIDLGNGDDEVYAESTNVGILNEGGLLLAGDGNDKITGIGSGSGIYNTRIYNKNGALEIGLIDLGEGANTLEGKGITGIFNFGNIAGGSGNDNLFGDGLGPLSGYYAGIENRGSIDSKGNWISNSTSIITGGGDDLILGRGERGIMNSSILMTGEGNDRALGIGTSIGIENWADIDLGPGNDLIIGEGAYQGIINNGLINTGDGDDEINALLGGFFYEHDKYEFAPTPTRGKWDLGKGNDLLKGFGTGNFWGGEGIDTIKLGEGSYKISGGKISRRNRFNQIVEMMISGFEQIGGANGGLAEISDGDITINSDGYLTANTSTTPAPTYSVTPSVTSINEGGTLTTSIATTNVASGTTLYYALSGTDISAADFSAGALNGQVTTGTNGSASFSHTLANDLSTEGPETLQIKLFSDSARTIQVGSTASVAIGDTSTTPAPTYSLTPSVTSINEGGTLTTSIATTNVASGTTLYYALSGTDISAADFSAGALNGQVTTGTNGSASFSHTLANDLSTEGPETLQIKLFSDSARTIQVGSTASVAISDTSTTPAPVAPTQQVYTSQNQLSYTPGSPISFPLLYNTSTADTNLTGLTLNVHYNSSLLTPSGANNGVSGLLSASIATSTLIPDTENADNDPLTDKIVQLLWASFDTKFPGTALPATLGTLSFSTSTAKTDPLTGQPLTTSLRYTASGTTAGYDFLTGSTTLKAQTFNLDVDGDGKITALGDGLMVIRKLFGPAFTGDALTNKALSPTATRNTAQIHDYLQQGIDSGLLDIDKDGKTTALGDGLMVIRRLFGSAFDGNALTNKALSPDSPYFSNTNASSIVAANIDALKPTTNTTPVI